MHWQQLKKETIAQVSKLLLEQGCLSEDVTEKVFELEEKKTDNNWKSDRNGTCL